MEGGLLLLRVVMGALMAAHGSQKLFGWFGGYGLNGTGGYFESLGFRPGRLFAAAAGASEFAGGLLLFLGFLQPVASALVIAVMLVAIVTVHWGKGLFTMTDGPELPLLYSAGVFALALTGPGRYSLDAALGLTAYWTPELTLGILGLGILGALSNLAVRRKAKTPERVAA